MKPSTRRLIRQLEDAIRSIMSDVATEPVPEAGRIYWKMFAELSCRRTYGRVGPNPLQWSEIEAWMRVRCCRLRQEDIEIILAMDGVYVEAAFKSDRGSPRSEATPQALDAVFDAAGW